MEELIKYLEENIKYDKEWINEYEITGREKDKIFHMGRLQAFENALLELQKEMKRKL